MNLDYNDYLPRSGFGTYMDEYKPVIDMYYNRFDDRDRPLDNKDSFKSDQLFYWEEFLVGECLEDLNMGSRGRTRYCSINLNGYRLVLAERLDNPEVCWRSPHCRNETCDSMSHWTFVSEDAYEIPRDQPVESVWIDTCPWFKSSICEQFALYVKVGDVRGKLFTGVGPKGGFTVYPEGDY